MLIRETKSVCPVCASEIDAKVVRKENNVFLIKECSKHGKFEVKISDNATEYIDFMKYYEHFRDYFVSKKPNGYCIFVNTKCNLNCPICFVDTHHWKKYKEPTVNEIRKFCCKYKDAEISLSGGEPTLREDLPQIIKAVISTGNTPVIYTNGIKIEDIDYLKTLKQAGLKTVGLQFDGFDPIADKKFRDKDMVSTRKKALANLANLGMKVTMMVTVAKGISDKNMFDIMEYAASNKSIKAVAFRAYTVMGCADKKEWTMTNQEMLASLSKQSNDRIDYQKVVQFQKLFYIFSKFFGFKNCSNMFYYLLVRHKGKYMTINEVLKLNRLNTPIRNYIKIKSNVWKWFYRNFVISPMLINARSISLMGRMAMISLKRLFGKPVEMDDLGTMLLPVMFENSCDRYYYENYIGEACPGCDLTFDGKTLPTCKANMDRERILRS